METISSADPSVIVVAAGAAFIAYLLLPPVWSAISFNFRGYKGTSSCLSLKLHIDHLENNINNLLCVCGLCFE